MYKNIYKNPKCRTITKLVFSVVLLHKSALPHPKSFSIPFYDNGGGMILRPLQPELNKGICGLVKKYKTNISTPRAALPGLS
jgi:hypothetical protein